jgi:hypothetical protein
MRLWLVLTALSSGIVSQTVENHIESQIRNWDTLNYLTLDCNQELFDIHTYSNENVTIYASMCRMLPQSTILEAKLPNSVQVQPSNLLIKRKSAGNVYYFFKNLTKNNGIRVQESNPQLSLYWYIPEINQDLHFILERNSNSTVDIRVDDEYVQTAPQNRNRRIVTKSVVTLTYGGGENSAYLSGIYNNTSFRVFLEIAVYILIGLGLLVPEHVVSLQDGKVSLRELLLYWLSLNFITDVTIECMGEHLPLLNLALTILLPAACTVLLASKHAVSRMDVAWNARLLFYVAAGANFAIVAVFYTATSFRNENYVLPFLYVLVLPLAARYAFSCSTSPEQFQALLLHFLVAVFVVCRVLQVFERPKGMVLRSVGAPLMGEYTYKASAGMAAILLAIPYQVLHIVVTNNWQKPDGAYKAFQRQESANDSHDDRSLSKL